MYFFTLCCSSVVMFVTLFMQFSCESFLADYSIKLCQPLTVSVSCTVLSYVGKVTLSLC
jgi:hypothetical protein